ncbi:MAG: S-layer protein [Candidatus Altiarchaeota archaeon]|nr:S-layer protein [Candidatus Altiarchaeota archaeon]
MDFKKIGTVAAGAAMIGASLVTPVLAGMDSTGIDTSFFYDSSYMPKVQIVVGDKANAGGPDDFVTAGNIAATVGNLAYMEETVTAGGGAAGATGKVLIETAALGAIGEYIQDTGAVIHEDFYSQNDAYDGKEIDYTFSDSDKTYEPGDFTQYAISCDTEELSEATVLQTMSSNNIHCLFCHTLCLEALENPSHTMKEKLYVDPSSMWYYETGIGKDDPEYLEMAIEEQSIKYILKAGWIPMQKMIGSSGTGSDAWVDFEYRGKMLFFGKEYYVKEIDGEDKIILADGARLDDITSEGYTSEYNGYKFKIDHLIYSGEYVVAGILLTVQKPDGTEVQRQISKMGNAVVDQLEISGVYAESSGGVETASILVYDIENQLVLEDDEFLTIGDETWTGWKVGVDAVECNGSNDCETDITQYKGLAASNNLVLDQVTVTLEEDVDEGQDDELWHALRIGDDFDIPGDFKLTFKGYMSSAFREVVCSGDGEGNIVVAPGEEPYQVVVSLTDEKNNRYDLRLDNGPFEESGDEDAFLVGGKMYQFVDASFSDEGNDNVDEWEIDLKAVGSGSKDEITLYRMCDNIIDNKSDAINQCDPSKTNASKQNCSCDAIDEVVFRTVALSDAFDDDDCGELSNDEEVERKAEDLFWAEATVNGVDMVLIYDEGDEDVIMSLKNPWGTSPLFNHTQPLLLVDPDLATPTVGGFVSTFDDFENSGSELDLWVERELDLYLYDLDACAAATSNGTDINADNNPDDLLIYAENEDGERVVIDMSERGQTESGGGDDYAHSVGVYTTECIVNGSNGAAAQECIFADPATNATYNCTNVSFSECVLQDDIYSNVVTTKVIDDDQDSILYVPEGGDTYTIDWGTDNEITSVEICHPQSAVDSTFFIGTQEEETVVYDEITDADVGSTISAGCCEFTVSNFTMESSGDGGAVSYNEVTVNDVGNLVVSEIGADTTKNLVIVGGPVVNGMSTVTPEELEASPDKYIVSKDGNKIMVAGYLASDTREAGDQLIQWLKENAH